jgi:hypothetical protein
MVINLGKTQVFKRHVPHAGNSFIGRNCAFANILQQFAEGSGIHLRIQINIKPKPTTEAPRHGEKQDAVELSSVETPRRCALHTFPDWVDIVAPGASRFFREDLPDKIVTFTWPEVTQVAVFKRDQFIVDCICMIFELNNKESLEVNENMEGWSTLVKAVPVYLSGALNEEEWWSNVVSPTFEPCFTEIYSRLANP